LVKSKNSPLDTDSTAIEATAGLTSCTRLEIDGSVARTAGGGICCPFTASLATEGGAAAGRIDDESVSGVGEKKDDSSLLSADGDDEQAAPTAMMKRARIIVER
jgi:hypothetical protein